MSVMMRRALCVGMVIVLLVSMLIVNSPSTSVEADSPEVVRWGIPHAPIRIDSNAEFSGIASSGNGTVWAPWVIEDFEIDGALSGNCIYVGNTTEYFIIQNCLLSNSSGLVSQPYWSDAGIFIYNSNNGHILNNTIFNITGKSGTDGEDAAGICLRFSDNNIIESNTIFNITSGNHAPAGLPGTGLGILLDALSDNNIISNNEISNIGVGNVVYFKDDMENGAMKWTHSSTLANINGESPLEYYFATELDTDVMSDWNSTLSVGIAGTDVTYYSFNRSFYFEEPVAGNSNKTAVTDIFNLTDHDSAILSFWHKYNLTADQNGVFLQVGYKDITQGAVDDWDWRYVDPAYYTGNLSASEFVNDTWGSPITGCWNNISGGGAYDWEYVDIDLTDFVPLAYSGEVRVKFNYTQFGGGSGDGWYVDDVRITASREENATIESEFKDVWQMANTTSHSGDNCWSNVDPSTGFLRGGIDNYLTTAPIDLTSAINANLTAYLRFNVNEDNGAPPDGFRVEVTNDNGITWHAINMGIRAAWNVSGTGTDAEDGNGTDGKAYSGLTDSGDPVADDYWIEVNTLSRINADLTSFVGNMIQIRFRVVSSNNVSYEHNNNNNCPDPGFGGLYLDDVEVRGKPLFELLDGRGIGITNSDDNQIYENNVSNCHYGAYSFGSVSNIIYHNNFVNNLIQAWDTGTNFWDNGYPSGGNYWSDYLGVDNFYGPSQDIAGGDGFGDTNYSISGGANLDNYPIMIPYSGQVLGPSVAVPPLALNYTPNGTAVPVDTVIEITWNETMNWTSIEEAFDYTDGVTVWNSTNGTWVFDSVTNVSTFTPDSDLDYETQYFVTVNCTATDIIGNKLDQNESGVGGEWPDDVLTWNFTTTDAVPRVVSTIPANNQVEVAPDTVIKVFFSEKMNTTSVEQAFSYTNGSVIWTVTNGSVDWNVGEDEITFTPTEPLEKNMTYTAKIDAGIAKDPGGKKLDWNYSWSFTTWTEPPLPHVIRTTPPDGSSNIGINAHINVEFDVAMDVGSVESVFSYTNGAGSWYGLDGTFQWSVDNTSFSFQPDEMLDHNTTYNVTVGASSASTYGMTLDGNANGIVDVDDNYSFGFKTAWAPPFVLFTSPANEETEVAENLPAISIDFNTRMNTVSVNAATSVYPAVANYSFVWNNDNHDLTILLGDGLRTGTFYQVMVLASATDLFGIKLDGNNDGVGGDNFAFTFITRGVNVTEAPYIVSVFPPPGNTTVPVNTFIGVSFSKAMNHTSVEVAFSLRNSTATINGTFTWSSAATVKFFPERELAKNTTYFVTIDMGATDTGGIGIEEPFSWQFITAGDGGGGLLGGNWWLIAIIVFLIVVVCIQYLKIRGTQVQLRRARVKIKRLKRGLSIEEGRVGQETADGPDKEPVEQPPDEPGNITEDIVNGESAEEIKPES